MWEVSRLSHISCSGISLLDYIAGAKELSQEVKEQLKSMSNVRSLTEDEKRDGGKKKKQALGGFIVLPWYLGIH